MNSHEINTAPQRKSGFIVVRLLSYKFAALTREPDGSFEWAEIGADTYIWTDRETAYAEGRSRQGLLCFADGIPTIGGITRYRSKLIQFQTSNAGDLDGEAALP